MLLTISLTKGIIIVIAIALVVAFINSGESSKAKPNNKQN